MAITSEQVGTAAAELAAMRRSLASWLRFRLLNDKVLAGKAKTRVPLAFAQRVIAQSRDLAVEQDLATKLHVLLSEVMPNVTLPNPDLRANPVAAVELANIALVGSSPTAAPPTGVGGILSASSTTHPWLWPVLIVGGLLLAITTAIKTAADVAKDAEEKACIRAGACTDFGFFLKVGGIAMLGFVAWKAGAFDFAKGLLSKRRS